MRQSLISSCFSVKDIRLPNHVVNASTGRPQSTVGFSVKVGLFLHGGGPRAVLLNMFGNLFRNFGTIIVMMSANAVPLCALADLVVDFSPVGREDVEGSGYERALNAVPFSLSSPISPKEGGVIGYTGSNVTFYGGIATNGSGGINLYNYNAGDASMRFRLRVVSPEDRANAVFIWKKEDFLNGHDEAPVKLDRNASFSVNARSFGSAVSGSVRFVIQEGDAFYISDVIGPIPRDFATLTMESAGDVRWFVYEPNLDIDEIGPEAIIEFEDANAVGVFFEVSSLATDQNITVAFRQMKVERN
jgi:hypothetical protein